MPTAPNVDNYTLGKGIVYFNPFDAAGELTVERDLGNCPAFTFNIAIEKLEHFSSRGGINSKDKEIVSQITPSVSFTLDEMSAENVNMFVMGDLTGGGETDGTIAAFANTQIEGRLRFVSDNPAGTQQQIIIHKVSLAPDGDAALIGNEWAQLSFTGEILKDTADHPDSPYMDITVSADAIAS